MRLHHAPLRTPALRRHLPVFRATDFRVIDGVNEGDPLTDASDLAYEDVYALAKHAAPLRLGLVTTRAAGPFAVSRDSGAGRPGARVYLDSLLTLMDPAGGAREVLVFVEVDREGLIDEVFLHALAGFPRGVGHALVTIDRQGAAARLAGTAHTAFSGEARNAPPYGAPRKAGALHLATGC